jgi:hypothetical protein
MMRKIQLNNRELKASHKRLENAFNNNMRDYKNNAMIILSNGTDSKVGVISSDWEHWYNGIEVSPVKSNLSNGKFQNE